MNKNIIMYVAAGVIIIAAAVLFGMYGNKPSTPVVGEDGKIEGAYSIESIMTLGKPYICEFEKSDAASKIIGMVYTDGTSTYSEFDIQTQALQNKPFKSFLLIKNDTTYTWTSLLPQGYKAPVAKSATKGATPSEQAQLVGTKDKMPYSCTPWTNVDSSVFDIPSTITFIELKA